MERVCARDGDTDKTRVVVIKIKLDSLFGFFLQMTLPVIKSSICDNDLDVSRSLKLQRLHGIH